jgi:hypothetical protein
MPQYPSNSYSGGYGYPTAVNMLYPTSVVGSPYLSGVQPNVQQYQPPQRPVMPQRSLNGMIVQSVENITADAVPMDGSIAVFPKQDMSEIYVKNWNADGTIRTITYKPVVETKPEVQSSNSFDESSFSDKLTDLTNRMNRLETSFHKMQSKQNQRKENNET